MTHTWDLHSPSSSDLCRPLPPGGGRAFCFLRRCLPALFVVSLLPAFPLHAQDFNTTTHTAAKPQTAKREEANTAMDAHDYAKAVTLLTPLAAENPKDAHLLYDLGAAQDALDQTAPAEASYRAAKADDPAFFDPRLALALLLARRGRLPDAREELAAAVTLPEAGIDPALRARAYRTLARIDQTARPADARDELLAALKLSPETPEDTLMAAELTTKSNNGAAAGEASLRKLVAEHPNDPQMATALAEVLMAQHRDDEAEPLLRGAAKANPGDPAVIARLAALLNRQGKAAEAVPLLAPVYAANQDSIELGHLMAELYTATGDYAQAGTLYQKLLVQSPGNLLFLTSRADALIRLKRYAEAQPLLAEAVAAGPGHFRSPEEFGQAAGALAFASSENNDPTGSLQALALRATVLPPTPSTLFLAAIALDKLHRTKQAQQAYKEFLAASNGALPDQEFEARHRLIALEHTK